MKRFVIFMLLVSIILGLCACSGGIDSKEAKDDIALFFSTVERGEYDEAAGFLHPDRPADLKSFFAAVGQEEGVDFSDIQIERYTGYRFSWYNSEYDGSACGFDIDVRVNGKLAEIEVLIVRNDAGYGIYEFDIDFED